MGNTSSQIVPPDQSQEAGQQEVAARPANFGFASLSPSKWRHRNLLSTQDEQDARGELTPPATAEEATIGSGAERPPVNSGTREPQDIEDTSDYHEASSQHIPSETQEQPTTKALAQRTPRSQRYSPDVLVTRHQSLETEGTPIRSSAERPTLLPPFETDMASKEQARAEREAKHARKLARAEKRARKESRNLQRALHTSDPAEDTHSESPEPASTGSAIASQKEAPKTPEVEVPSTAQPLRSASPVMTQSPSVQKEAKKSQKGPQESEASAATEEPVASQNSKKRARSNEPNPPSPQKKKSKKQPVEDVVAMRSSPPVHPSQGFTAINGAKPGPPKTNGVAVNGSPKKQSKKAQDAASGPEHPLSQVDIAMTDAVEASVPAESAISPESTPKPPRKEKKKQKQQAQQAESQLQEELEAEVPSQPAELHPSPKKKTTAHPMLNETEVAATQDDPASGEVAEPTGGSQSPKKRNKKKKKQAEEEVEPEVAAPEVAADEAMQTSPKKKRKQPRSEPEAVEAAPVTETQTTNAEGEATPPAKKRSKKAKSVTAADHEDALPDETQTAPSSQKNSKKKSKAAANTALDSSPAAESSAPSETAAQPEVFVSEYERWKMEHAASHEKQKVQLKSKIANKSRKSTGSLPSASKALGKSSRKSTGSASTPARLTPRVSIGPLQTGPFSDEERSTVERTLRAYRTEYGISAQDLKAYFASAEPEHNSDRKVVYDMLVDALPQRERKSIRQFLHRFLSTAHRGPWMDDEDQQLKELYAQRPSAWTWIAGQMDRFPEDCRDRWRDVSGLGDRETGPWQPNEVDQLREAVGQAVDRLRKEHAGLDDAALTEKVNWSVVSSLLGGARSRLQCRYKWAQLRRSEAGLPRAKGGRRKAYVRSEALVDDDDDDEEEEEQVVNDNDDDQVPTDADPLYDNEVPETDDELPARGDEDESASVTAYLDNEDVSSSIIESSPEAAGPGSPELGGGGVWSSAQKPKGAVYGRKKR